MEWTPSVSPVMGSVAGFPSRVAVKVSVLLVTDTLRGAVLNQPNSFGDTGLPFPSVIDTIAEPGGGGGGGGEGYISALSSLTLVFPAAVTICMKYSATLWLLVSAFAVNVPPPNDNFWLTKLFDPASRYVTQA